MKGVGVEAYELKGVGKMTYRIVIDGIVRLVPGYVKLMGCPP